MWPSANVINKLNSPVIPGTSCFYNNCVCWPVHHIWRFGNFVGHCLVRRCTCLCGSVADVWFCISVWDSDIPDHWLASGPWDQCAAVWAFPILQNPIRRFLCCWNLRPFHSSSQNVIHGAVSLLPWRAVTAGETVQSPCIDWFSTDAGVWLACLTAKSLSHC